MINRRILRGALFALAMGLAASAVSADDNGEIRNLLAAQRYEQALAVTVEQLKQRPNDVELRVLHGVALARTGALDNAVEVFKKLIVNNPSDPQLMNNLAAIYASQGDYRSAEDMLNRAVLLSPDYSVARSNLGDLYISMAQTQYNSALRSDPGNPALRAKMNALSAVMDTPTTMSKKISTKRPIQGVRTRAPSTPAPSSSPVVAAPIKLMNVCFMSGPYVSASKLAKARHWLESQNAHVIEKVRKVKRVVNKVYLPADSLDRPVAEQVENLRKLGLRDIREIKSGALQGGISLGVFRNPDSVERRINELQKSGYSAKVLQESFTSKRPWLQVQPAINAPVNVSELMALFNKGDAVGLDLESGCDTTNDI